MKLDALIKSFCECINKFLAVMINFIAEKERSHDADATGRSMLLKHRFGNVTG